jgi:hypothetical protein
MHGLGFDLTEIFEAAAKLPKLTQQVSSVVGAAKTVQTPEFQAQLQKVQRDLTDYAYAQLALQTLSTFAIIGLFALNLAQSKKG